MELLMVLKAPKPLQLSDNVAENWKEFKEDFTIYMGALELDGASDKQKTSMLLNIIVKESSKELHKVLHMNMGVTM